MLRRPDKEVPAKRAIDPATRRVQHQQETLVYGQNAVEAVFRERPQDIIKAYFTDDSAPHFGEGMRMLAAARKAYRIVPEDELARITKSAHAGGVAIVAKKRVAETVVSYLKSASSRPRDCVLALEEVGNPHNIGAMMRSAAHFGVKAIVCADAGALDGGAAARVAEGGAEAVDVLETRDFLRTLGQFHHEGYAIVTTSSHQGKNIYHTELPARMVLVMGEEQGGVTLPSMQASDVVLRIPGTGMVESLNVGVAAALILGEWWRQK